MASCVRGELAAPPRLHFLQRIVGVGLRHPAEDFERPRVSSAPVRSIATMVFSKVGSAVCRAMLSTSRSCCRIPSSIAGW